MLAYIALGSNLGNRYQHLVQGAEDINRLHGCQLLQMSSVYETDPMGPQNQPDYLNAVCAVACDVDPHQLLVSLKAIESEHGREQQSARWSARPLDLDILLFGERQVYSRYLQIPHPGIAVRSFVLWPLAELDSKLNIPGVGHIDCLMHWCENLGIRLHIPSS
jgi:2-amino-4-hydroxy-6-hydroxymethyldihydropteridine diphosphokinase